MTRVTITYRTGTPVVQVVSDERAVELEQQTFTNKNIVSVEAKPIRD